MILSGVTGIIGGTEIFGGGCFTGSATVTGATVGMVVNVSPRTYPGAGITWQGYVSAPNVVTVKVCTSIAAFVTASLYDVQVNDGGNSSIIQAPRVTLSAADIQGMFAAPVQILAAQGAGTLIVPVKMVCNAIFGSLAFSGGGNITLTFPTSALAGGPTAAFLTSFAANQLSTNAGFTLASGLSSACLNAALSITNATGAFTGGTGCSMTVDVEYYTLTGLQ